MLSHQIFIFSLLANIFGNEINLTVNVILTIANDNNCQCINIFNTSGIAYNTIKLLSNVKPIRSIKWPTKNGIFEADISCLNLLSNPTETFWQQFLIHPISLGVTLAFEKENFEQNLYPLGLKPDTKLLLAISTNKSFQIVDIYGINGKFLKKGEIIRTSKGKWENIRDLRVVPETRKDFKQLRINLGLSGDFNTLHARRTQFISSFTEASSKGSLVAIFRSITNQLNISLQYASDIYDLYDRKNFERALKRTAMGDEDDWRRMWNLLVNNKFEGTISTFTMTSERSKQVKFLHPIVTSRIRVYLKDAGNQVSWGAIFKPFGSDVWIAIIFWAIAASISLVTASVIARGAGMDTNWPPRESVLFLFRSISQQGPDIIPKIWSGRIIMLLAYIATGVLIPSYSASLVSYLTQDGIGNSFESINDISDDPGWKILVEENSSTYDFLIQSNIPILQKLHPQLEVYAKHNSAMAKVCEDKPYGIVMGEMHMDFHYWQYLPEKCYIDPLREKLQDYHEANAFVKNSPLVPSLNYELLRHRERGLLHRYFQHMWRRRRPLRPSFYRHVELNDVLQMYVVFFISAAVSFLIFLIEVILSKLNSPLLN